MPSDSRQLVQEEGSVFVSSARRSFAGGIVTAVVIFAAVIFSKYSSSSFISWFFSCSRRDYSLSVCLHVVAASRCAFLLLSFCTAFLSGLPLMSSDSSAGRTSVS